LVIIDAVGGSKMSKLIDRYPAHASVITCTATDFQTAARFDVYEGDAGLRVVGF
jgi:hypothetical protein